jgi:enolase
MSVIEHVSAMEILDSRGRPTVKATLSLAGGVKVSASVPSGASTGAAEALELRDGDPKRYGGLGCRKAVANVNGEIASALAGKEWSQESLDRRMIGLDTTPGKSRIGANAMLAVSIAFARAQAMERRVPLHQHFGAATALPRLTINLFSGGKHAGGQVPIQDVLIVPLASTIEQGLADAYAVYYAAAKLIGEKYQMRLLRADEGGLAPPSASVEAMFDDAVESIRRAGLEPGRDVALAIDVASSHFYRDGQYHLGGAAVDSAQMVNTIAAWVANYPIVSIEDGLSEEDWRYWPMLREVIGDRALVLGDDFLCTNPARIARAVKEKSANALLLKVNQIGTLTEAGEARRIAKDAGWKVTISARSGETEDNWLADLAVGWGGDQIKIGSITQSERLAKYNRLLEIEAQTRLPVVSWPRM